MVRNRLHTEFSPIEARIRAAGAERSVEVGYAIGDALAQLTVWIESLFAARRVHSHRFGRPLGARH